MLTKGQQGLGESFGQPLVLSGDTAVGASVRVGVGGTLILKGIKDDAFTTLENVADGEYIPGLIAEIKETGTTCTNIVPIQ